MPDQDIFPAHRNRTSSQCIATGRAGVSRSDQVVRSPGDPVERARTNLVRRPLQPDLVRPRYSGLHPMHQLILVSETQRLHAYRAPVHRSPARPLRHIRRAVLHSITNESASHLRGRVPSGQQWEVHPDRHGERAAGAPATRPATPACRYVVSGEQLADEAGMSGIPARQPIAPVGARGRL